MVLLVLLTPAGAEACPQCRLAVRRAVYDQHFGARAAMTIAPFALAGALGAALPWWIDRGRRRGPR
jgi:hypothetical protein